MKAKFWVWVEVLFITLTMPFRSDKYLKKEVYQGIDVLLSQQLPIGRHRGTWNALGDASHNSRVRNRLEKQGVVAECPGKGGQVRLNDTKAITLGGMTPLAKHHVSIFGGPLVKVAFFFLLKD